MKLYHSSALAVRRPDTIHSRPYLDFGKGFYLTSIYEQAVKYGQRFIRRNKSAWLNIYEFEIELSEWKVLSFNSYDKAWLDFVSKCRVGKDDTEYDLIIGGIANDKVIQTLDRYFAGELSENEALGFLKYEKPNIQYCVRSQTMIDKCLTYIESIRL